MGLFDYFSKDAASERRRAAARKKLTNMYYQQADRMAAADSVFGLAEEGDTEAVKVLLQRFEHLCPSTTVDREEKDYVVSLLVGLGDKGVETIVDYCKKTTKPIYWPLKVLEQLWDDTLYDDFVAELLEATDNGYWRDPEKKIGLVQIAAHCDTDRVAAALVPFLEDHTEEVRLGAVDSLMAKDETPSDPLLDRLASGEESLRVRKRLAEGIAAAGWTLGDRKEAVAANLPPGFTVSGDTIAAA